MLSLQQRGSAVNGADLLMVERSLTSEVLVNNLTRTCEVVTQHVMLSQTACACALKP